MCVVWPWFGFGLAWLAVRFVRSSCFPLSLLGLASVWFGLARGVFCKLIVLSNESACFGIGLAWFGLVCFLK